jgi:hypothetical protein
VFDDFLELALSQKDHSLRISVKKIKKAQAAEKNP